VEAFDESWIFAVFMCVLVGMLIVRGIRDYRARRKLPKNPDDIRTNRKLALDNLKFFLGIKDKDDGDNPMKHQAGDDGVLFK
jgi:hypothetical protein